MKKWGKVFVAMGLAVALLCGCGGGQESGEKGNGGGETAQVEKTVEGTDYFGATVEDFDQMVEDISDKLPLESRKVDEIKDTDMTVVVYAFTPSTQGAGLQMVLVKNLEGKLIDVTIVGNLDIENDVTPGFSLLIRKALPMLEPDVDLDRFELDYKLNGNIEEDIEGKEGNTKIVRFDGSDSKGVSFIPV